MSVGGGVGGDHRFFDTKSGQYYVKELVLKNFAGLPADQMLERMIELSLYAEEKLKSG